VKLQHGCIAYKYTVSLTNYLFVFILHLSAISTAAGSAAEAAESKKFRKYNFYTYLNSKYVQLFLDGPSHADRVVRVVKKQETEVIRLKLK